MASATVARPAPLRFTEFRAAVDDSFVPLQVSSDRPGPFRGTIRHASSHEVHIAVVEADEHVVQRTSALIQARPRHCFKVGMQLDGHGLLVQGNRETVLRPGSLTIYDTEKPYSLAFDGPFRSLVVMFPAQLLDLPLDAVGELTATSLNRKGGVGEVIAPFLRGLADHPEAVAGPAGARLARNAVDLVGTLLSQELTLTRTKKDPRAELFCEILAFIDRHLTSPGLDPATIAAAHFISPRLLHALFQENDSSVAAHVRRRRLEECRKRLTDVAHSGRSVMSIAAEWGFSDAAHFSHAFRAAFGCSPSQARRQAASPDIASIATSH